MMIANTDELAVSRQKLRELQTHYKAIIANPPEDDRLKEMELAGVRGVMEEIEAEMLTFIRGQFQEYMDSPSANRPVALDETLGGLDAVAEGLRLTSSARRESQLASLPVAE